MPASGDICCLLVAFANSLDPNVGPDLDSLIVYLKEFIEKVNFEICQQMRYYPACKELRTVKKMLGFSHCYTLLFALDDFGFPTIPLPYIDRSASCLYIFGFG